MEDYASELDDLWKEMERKQGKEWKIKKGETRAYGSLKLKYAKSHETKGGSLFSATIEIEGMDVGYLKKAEGKIHEELLDGDFKSVHHYRPLRIAGRAATLGLGGEDFACIFYSAGGYWDLMSKIFKERGDISSLSIIGIGHKKSLRGKGKAYITAVAPSGKKAKKYISGILKSIQEKNR